MSKVHAYDRKLKELFETAIHSIARQIVDDYNIIEGTCLDIGCGTALLAIELAKLSNLTVYALDICKSMCKVAYENIRAEYLLDRVFVILGDVHCLPFKDNSVDLIVGRSVYHLWQDKVLAFKEIYRVLRPGGVALIGSGYGRYIARTEAHRLARIRDRVLGNDAVLYKTPDLLESIVSNVCASYQILHNDTDLWVEIRKPH